MFDLHSGYSLSLREVGAGTQQDLTQKHCLCVSSLPSAQLTFLRSLPRDGAAHSELVPTTSITNQDSAPQTGSQANRIGTASQLRFLLSRCVKLTRKTNHDRNMAGFGTGRPRICFPEGKCGSPECMWLCPRRVTVYLYVHIRIYIYAHST